MMRHLALALALIASPLAAQPVAPGRLISVTPDAKEQLDSMARRTLRTRTEQAVCLTTYGMEDSTLVVFAVKPAQHIVRADSIGIDFLGQPGAWWQPCIHSHFLGWDQASPDDAHFAALRGVFGLLMIVKADTTWTLKAYP